MVRGDRMANRANGAALSARLAAAAALAMLCAACAGDPLTYSVVSQDRYDFMTCAEINGQQKSHAGREKELAALVEKAESAPGGIIVSYAAYRSELAQTRGLLAAANRAAAKNGCAPPK
jgi:hypothetical protein